MVDMGSIAAAVTSLKAATDIAKAIFDIKASTEIQGKVIELQTVILAAQSSALAAQSDQFSLLERVRDLETHIADLEAWEAEKQRYELQQVSEGGSVFAYVLKLDAQGSEPPHQICAHCYGDGHKSILQTEYTDVGRWRVLMCNSCGAKIWPDGGGEPSNHKPRTRSPSWGRAKGR
jgi:hypothetical protein